VDDAQPGRSFDAFVIQRNVPRLLDKYRKANSIHDQCFLSLHDGSRRTCRRPPVCQLGARLAASTFSALLVRFFIYVARFGGGGAWQLHPTPPQPNRVNALETLGELKTMAGRT
jgi:hypothetical protein